LLVFWFFHICCLYSNDWLH